MANTEREPATNSSLKLAIAIALIRSKLLSKPPDSSSDLAESDVQRWKRKAKERKLELRRLREELKELEDGTQYDLFPQSASCKCYFFDNFGKLSSKRLGDDCDRRVNEVLHRRFLRQVRFKERRKKSDGSLRRWRLLDINSEDEIDQLRASVDFLVELCDNVSLMDTSFCSLSHQAVDFILASLKSILSKQKNKESIEAIVNSLITRLVRRMCTPLQRDESCDSGSDAEFYIQHLIRKLGIDPYIGQRILLLVSQRISSLADSSLFMDPFDDAFPNMHSSMFMMILLIEFLITEYLKSWTRGEGFDNGLFQEWFRSVLQSRKALELLESRNGLYVLYMDRVKVELAKQVGQISSFQTLDQEILDNLFC